MTPAPFHIGCQKEADNRVTGVGHQHRTGEHGRQHGARDGLTLIQK